MKKYSYTILAASLLLLAGFFYKRYHVPPSIDLPVIALTDLSGHPVSLSSYAGRPLFLNFFATWCGPCIHELPALAGLRDSLAAEKLQVICICDEPIEKLQAIQARFGSGLVILHSEKTLHDLGVYTYPTNYIYNARGQKIYDQVNAEDWESADVQAKVRKLLEKGI